MAIKHTVTFPDGTTSTRTSKNRSYGFAIAVSPETKAERIGWLTENIDRYTKDAAENVKIAEYLESNGELVARGSWLRQIIAPGLNGYTVGYNDETREYLAAHYRRNAADNEKALAKTLTEIAETQAGPELVGPWRLTGWQSRDDLAAKELATQTARHCGHEVLILVATQTGKGAN